MKQAVSTTVEIGEALVGGRVKQRDVAARAGVSVSTVSRVFNNMPGLSDDLRRQVLAAAAALGHTPADALTRGQLRHLTVLSDMTSREQGSVDFLNGILHGIAQECQAQGIQMAYQLRSPANLLPAEVLGNYAAGTTDAFLLLSAYDREILDRISAVRAPTIVVNGLDPLMHVDTLMPANVLGGRLSTEHLIGLGHTRIANLTFLRRLTLRDRLQGYRDAHELGGIPVDEGLIIDMEGGLTADAGYRAVSTLLDSGRKFTAIACGNDGCAAGVMAALEERGIAVPRDLSVVGFDDVPLAAMMTPPLTTIHIPLAELGAAAVRRLNERVRDPRLTPTRSEIRVHFTLRNTTAPPKA